MEDGRRQMEEGNQKIQTSRYKIDNPGDVIYRMVIIVDNILFHILRLLRESSHHKNKKNLCVVMDVN